MESVLIPGKEVKIIFDELGRSRIYKGIVLFVDSRFVVIDDIKIGKLELNRNNIVKSEEWIGDNGGKRKR